MPKPLANHESKTIAGWLPEEIDLVVRTAPRKPDYPDQTLASLFASDPLSHRLGRIAIVAPPGLEMERLAHP